MERDPFKEYLIQSEPSKRDKGYAWHTAIGLQAVDGLKPSQYLVNTAIQNIEGEITLDEAQALLDSYYQENPKADGDERTEEADKVSVRIAKLLSENAWYFRNALVRANYNDLKRGIHMTTEYLELFLRNLLLDEKNELHNCSMHVSGMFEKEVDIESAKVDIQNKLFSFSNVISDKTVNHALEISSRCGKEEYFGRKTVEDITGLKSSGASKLIKLLLDSNVIIPVAGHGKGKYRFR